MQSNIAIAGGGLAGLTLASALVDASIPFTIFEKSQKNTNDRTWCFWTSKPEQYQDVMHHSWKQFKVASHTTQRIIDLGEYTYCMIRSKQWYDKHLSKIKNYSGAKLVTEHIQSTDPSGTITTTSSVHQTSTLFSSIPDVSYTAKPPYTLLKQSFLGWWIESGESSFDPNIATFMDFRTPQDIGTCFLYVLPVSTTKALVEYTVFAKSTAEKSMYEERLKNYIKSILNIATFTVLETEWGVLPMTDDPMEPLVSGNLIKIGTPGGFLKPSSGFGFRRTETKIASIVSTLTKGYPVLPSTYQSKKRFRLYDSTLLKALSVNPTWGEVFFNRLFETTNISEIFAFLDEETTLLQEVRIMIKFVSLAPYFLTRLLHADKL